jgi:hypothetical protein
VRVDSFSAIERTNHHSTGAFTIQHDTDTCRNRKKEIDLITELKFLYMLTKKELLITPEYWKETFENSLWRVQDGQVGASSETTYLVEKVMELIKNFDSDAPVESRSDTDNEQAEKKCVHPREQRRYIGRGWLKCDLCGEEFQ